MIKLSTPKIYDKKLVTQQELKKIQPKLIL